MADDLRILIQAAIDEKLSIAEINAAILRIQNSGKLKELNLKINIDKNLINSLNNLNSNLTNLSKSISSISTADSKMVSSTQQVTQQVNTQTKAVERQNDALEKNNAIKTKVTKFPDGLIRTDTTTGTKNDSVTTPVWTHSDGVSKVDKQSPIVSVTNNEALREAEKNFERFTDNTKSRIKEINKSIGNNNKLTKELKNEFSSLNAESSKADFSHFENKLKNLESYAKGEIKTLQELDNVTSNIGKRTSQTDLVDQQKRADAAQKFMLQEHETRVKEAERIDRDHYNALKTNQQRIEAADKQHYLALQQNAKRDLDYQQSIADRRAKIADLTRRFGSDANVRSQLVAAEKQLSSIKNIGNFKTPLRDVDIELKNITASASTATSHTLNFAEALRTAFVKFPVWLISGTVFIQATRFFTQGIEYVNSLDKSLNQIAIVLGETQQGVQGLAKEYNNLAREMSVTTKEIADASVEFLRQGLSQEETMRRVRVATQYAKISNIEFKESAEILTASVNSMNIPIERAADVFSYLGDATATGADEIGRAFQKVGGSAGALNISFEKTASWIAVLSSRTRESAETIGQSVKSILARVQSLKENGFDEEDGTQINQVSKALAQVGIELVDSQGQFNDFGSVMDELGAKWSTLDSRTKAYLATVIAGTFQQSRFLNLMEGYQDTIPLYEKALNAAGTSQQKFATYQESTEAAVNRVTSAMESLWSDTFNSNSIRTVLDSMTSLIGVVDGLMSTLGPMPTLVGLVTTGLVLFTKSGISPLYSWALKIPPAIRGMALSFHTLAEAEGIATAATITLRTALLSIARTVAPIAIITGLTYGITALISHQQKLRQEQKEFEQQQKQIADNYTSQKDKIKDLLIEHQELEKTLGDSASTNERYLEVSNELAQLMPNLVDSIDKKGDAHLKNADAIKDELFYAKKLSEQEKQQKILDASDEFNERLKQLEKLKTQISDVQNQINSGIKNPGTKAFSLDSIFDNISKNPFGKDSWNVFNILSDSDINKLETKTIGLQRLLSTSLESTKDYVSELSKVMVDSDVADQFSGQIDEIVESLNLDGLDSTELVGKASAVANFFETIKKYQGATSLSSATGFQQSLIEQGKAFNLNEDQVKLLVSAYQSYSKETQTASQQQQGFSKVLDEASGKFNEYSGELKDINQVIQDVSSGQSLNAETVVDLIEKYPQLADKIKQTSDGWTIEKDALNLVREAKIEQATASKLAEEGITGAVYSQLQNRLSYYGVELDAIKDLATAKVESEKLVKGIGEHSLFVPQELTDQILQLQKIGEIRERFNKLFSDKKYDASGGSSSSPQLKDALQQQDLTKELISAYNEEYDIRQKNIDSLERQIKTAEKAKDQVKVVELTNKKIQEQIKSLDGLRDAQANFNKEANLIRSQRPDLDTEKWFDVNGEASQAFKEFLNTFAERSEVIRNNTKISVKDRNKEIEQLQKQQDEVETMFNHLYQLKQAWKANADEIIKVTDSIDDSKQSLIDLSKEINDTLSKINQELFDKQGELRDHISGMADDIIDIYKDYYQALKDANIKAIDLQIDSLDKEIKKYEELYDAQLKLIDKEEANEEYIRKLNKLKDEQQSIQKDLNVAILNDDISNKKRREELEKALADKTTEINELVHDREIDLRKENLNNSLDVLKKDAEAKKEKLENEKTATEEHWDDLINDESKFAEIRRQVMSGMFDDILSDFAKFKVNIGSNSALIGDSMSKNIIDKISKMETQITTSTDLMGNLFTTLGQTLEDQFISKLRTILDDLDKLNKSKTDALNAQLQNTIALLNQIKTLSNSWGNLSPSGQQDAHDQVVVSMAQFDQTWGTQSSYNSSTGKWTVKKNGTVVATGSGADISTQLQAWVQTQQSSGGTPSGGFGGSTTTTPSSPTSGGNNTPPQQETEKYEVNYYRNNENGSEFGITKSRPTWADNDSTKYTWLRTEEKTRPKTAHTGDLVDASESSPLAKALHESFNLNKNEKLMKLLKSEVVINPDNFKPMNFVQSVLSSLKLPDFSSLSPRAAASGVGGSNININFKIDKMYANESEVQSFGSKIIDVLNRKGV